MTTTTINKTTKFAIQVAARATTIASDLNLGDWVFSVRKRCGATVIAIYRDGEEVTALSVGRDEGEYEFICDVSGEIYYLSPDEHSDQVKMTDFTEFWIETPF